MELHPSYSPHHLVEISTSPFHLTRRGWGVCNNSFPQPLLKYQRYNSKSHCWDLTFLFLEHCFNQSRCRWISTETENTLPTSWGPTSYHGTPGKSIGSPQNCKLTMFNCSAEVGQDLHRPADIGSRIVCWGLLNLLSEDQLKTEKVKVNIGGLVTQRAPGRRPSCWGVVWGGQRPGWVGYQVGLVASSWNKTFL